MSGELYFMSHVICLTWKDGHHGEALECVKPVWPIRVVLKTQQTGRRGVRRQSVRLQLQNRRDDIGKRCKELTPP